MRKAYLIAVIIPCILMTCLGCARRRVPEPMPEPTPIPEPTPVPESWQVPGEISEEELARQKFEEEKALVLVDIHFEYDKSLLSMHARNTLSGIGDWMLKQNEINLLIEGHCDERGANEYNLALGERRATAAYNYLVSYGIAPSRLRKISYGEERPVDPGHTESAWSKNRRGHFSILD